MADMEPIHTIQSKDEGRLAELGYKQELRRDWGLLQNFGCSFSIIVSSMPLICAPEMESIVPMGRFAPWNYETSY